MDEGKSPKAPGSHRRPIRPKFLSVFEAAKRLGLRRYTNLGDWFESWSPENRNQNAEGNWHHWVNLAAMILSHPATKLVAPHLYRPRLRPDKTMYTKCNELSDGQVAELFREYE